MAYLKRTYGNLVAFLLGWAQTVIYFPANIAALAIIFGTQTISLFGLTANDNQSLIVIIAIATALFLTLMNFLGAKAAGAIQTIATVCKLIPLVLIIIFGLLHKGDVPFQLFPVEAGADKDFLTALGSGLLATMFAYDGWILVGNIAGEMKNPKKDLPRAIILGLSAVMTVYLLINVAFLMVMSAASLAGTDTPASDAASLIFGAFGGKFVSIGILISVFGSINGYVMTGMRIPYAMATENKLPFSKWFGRLSKKSKVPYNSGIFILFIAIIMMTIGGFNTLTDMLVFVIWIFYTMTFAAVLILRKREPDLQRPYRVPLYPVLPLISLLGGLFIVINTLFTQTTLALWGLGITALGLPIYFAMKKNHINN